MEEELGLNSRPGGTPAAPAGAPVTPFYVCGMAVDAQDNLYTVDAHDPVSPKLLRFDRDGIITARYELPETYAQGFFPGPNCLEVDDRHIYLSTFIGKLLIMDRQAHLQHSVALPERPIDFTISGDGELLVLGSAYLERVQVETGNVVTATLPLLPQHQRIPYGAIVADGEHGVLVTDLASKQILRIDLSTNEIVGSFGSAGYEPGQFIAPAGMGVDRQGRIYVADVQHRVIERFTAEGKIESLLWAALSFPEGPQQAVEID
jgi:DNA-binding beta-propeller fold protein YncE